jgi:hypothetical protein
MDARIYGWMELPYPRERVGIRKLGSKASWMDECNSHTLATESELESLQDRGWVDGCNSQSLGTELELETLR